MNAIVFVLVLASSDGGINTDLKFSSMAACRATAGALMGEVESRGGVFGNRGGFRYVRAICVQASGLISKGGAA